MHTGTTFGIILLFLCSSIAFGQEELNSAVVERETYRLYQEKNWDELISYGTQAVHQGYDYFYLRYRIGMAYYEKKQYRAAAVQFEKALSFNSGDISSSDYLYYSLIFSERYDEAEKVRHRSAYGPDLSTPINFVYAEGALKVPDRRDLFNPAYYSQFGVGHRLGHSVSVLHAISTYYQTESRGNIFQFQYYLQTGITLNNGWSLYPALHLLALDFKSTSLMIKSLDYVAALAVAKSTSHVDVSAGVAWSTVLSPQQFIQQTRLTIYPWGKPSFSFGAYAYLHTEVPFAGGSSQWNPMSLAINPYISWSPSPRVKLYGSYYANKTENIVEQNGYLINNSPDLTTSRSMGMLTWGITRHWDLYGAYQLEKRTTATTPYQYNVFLIGIKFKPK